MASGRSGSAKKKKYQDFLSWPGWCSPCDSFRGCAALRMASRSTISGWFIAVAQATLPPQSCPDEHRGLGAAFVDQVADVAGKLVDVVVSDALWP